MKTTQTTDTYAISITDINLDSDNPSHFEISFESTLTPAYLRSTRHFTNSPTPDFIDFDDLYDDINDFADTDPYVTYQFNVAHRHENSLYFIIKHDRHGDTFTDDYDAAICAFGQPIIDFIDNACQLLNIPFYPTR